MKHEWSTLSFFPMLLSDMEFMLWDEGNVNAKKQLMKWNKTGMILIVQDVKMNRQA